MQLQDLRVNDQFRLAGDARLYTVQSRCDCGQIVVRDQAGDRRRFSCQDGERPVELVEAVGRVMGG